MSKELKGRLVSAAFGLAASVGFVAMLSLPDRMSRLAFGLAYVVLGGLAYIVLFGNGEE
jgi:hypothetical protein